LIIRPEQVMVAGTWDHPQLFRLAGGLEKAVGVFRPGLGVLSAADDEDGAGELGDVPDGLDLIQGYAGAVLGYRDDQAAAKPTGNAEVMTKTAIHGMGQPVVDAFANHAAHPRNLLCGEKYRGAPLRNAKARNAAHALGSQPCQTGLE